jgi:mannose-6-phosphate isomerase
MAVSYSLVRQPLRFEPFLRPMIWGGRRLARFVGKNLKTEEPYGESWEVSDHSVHRSRLTIATGYGVTLRQLMKDERPELIGTGAERFAAFPWLIKLLDANDWLSVQVHPDENAVKLLMPGEGAKSEAWLVFEASPTSKIYAGLKPGVGPAELRQALDRGAVAECLHWFTPKPGDFVYLPAGNVHAVGGGVLLAEIQETSDATFRLFDWNRKDAQGRSRPLHIDESFASIRWDQGATNPIAVDQAPSGRLVRCPFFDIDWVRWPSTVKLGGTGRLQAWIVTEGRGRFANGEYVMAGDAWILPASMPAMDVTPDAPFAGLLCTLPLAA